MYSWEANPEELARLAEKFHADTTRANVFRARRTPTAVLSFTGDDAVGYFRSEFQQDPKQAMAFGKAVMSAGVFLAADGSQNFVNGDRSYRFTWESATETADKIRMQLCRERRPASYDQEQRVDEGVDLLSDQEFSIASLSSASQAQENPVASLVNDSPKASESAESGEDATDWLDEPGEGDYGAGITLISSNSTGGHDCDDEGQDRGACVDRARNDQMGDGGDQSVDGRPLKSNLAALGILRTKLSTAVQRQTLEKPDRLLSMKARASALEYLESDLSSNPSPTAHEREDGSGWQGESSLVRSNGVDKESDGLHDRPCSEVTPAEVMSSNCMTGHAFPPDSVVGQSLVRSNGVDKESDGPHERPCSGLTPAEFISANCMTGDAFPPDSVVGQSNDLRNESKKPKRKTPKDIVSVRNILRPRGGANMRQFRVTPGKPGWKSSEGSEPNQQEEVLESPRVQEDRENLSREIQHQSADHLSSASSRGRSQPQSRASSKTMFSGCESGSSDFFALSPRREGSQSKHLSPQRVPTISQGPVSMRRRISSVLSKASTDTAFRKSDRQSQSPTKAVTSAGKTKKRTAFPTGLE